MTFHVRLDTWVALCADARSVRTDVFIDEQKIPIELEWDDMDACSIHAVAYDDSGWPIGTGRLLPDGHIGRMAVRQALRNKGIGSALLAELMQAAKRRGDHEVMLNAQITAQSFYVRCGFIAEGDEFLEAGIVHVHMRRELT
jgi:predicted GNAT family N-acyltransferase